MTRDRVELGFESGLMASGSVLSHHYKAIQW